MTFQSTVVRVLIASPGDTQAARAEILKKISRWNGRHAGNRGFIFLPWLYELHAYSTYSSSPDVASQVVHALEDDLPTLDSGPAPSPSVAAALDSSNSVSAPARAKLGVHHEHETQAIGTDKRGKMSIAMSYGTW